MVAVGEDKVLFNKGIVVLNGMLFVYIGLLMINEIIYLIWLEILILSLSLNWKLFFNTFWMK